MKNHNKIKFVNNEMNYKCAKCGFECKNIATALEHRDFYNGVGCGGDIVTSSTIDEWNDIYAKP